jgi:hydroxypyruvate isomerase
VIRWSINISTLLKEYAFLDRFKAAADLGFGAVEFAWPADTDLNALVKAKESAGVKVALFNADGDLTMGERGYLGNPSRADYIRANFRQALDLAKVLECPLIHVLGGNIVSGIERYEQLAEAARIQRELCTMASASGAMITLEAMNRWDAPRYLFSTTAQALEQIDRVGSRRLKLQYDVYHMQRMEGNITTTLQTHIGQIAHIQIADVPGRNQPGTGELNFPYIFEHIESLDYAGYIGLEYIAPGGNTEAALNWLPRECRIEYDAHGGFR